MSPSTNPLIYSSSHIMKSASIFVLVIAVLLTLAENSAASASKLQQEKVGVVSTVNTPSNNAMIESFSIENTNKRLLAKENFENYYSKKIRNFLDNVLGKGKYALSVNVDLDWNNRHGAILKNGNNLKNGVITSEQQTNVESYDRPLQQTIQDEKDTVRIVKVYDPHNPEADEQGYVEMRVDDTAKHSAQYHNSRILQKWAIDTDEEHLDAAPGQISRVNVGVLTREQLDENSQQAITNALNQAIGNNLSRGDSVFFGVIPFNSAYSKGWNSNNDTNDEDIQKRMETINDFYDELRSDISNFTTPGYKAIKISSHEIMNFDAGPLSRHTSNIQFTQGKVKKAGNSLDLAIQDGAEGSQSLSFFVLSNGKEIKYTRAGHFNFKDGKLVDPYSTMQVQGFELYPNGRKKSERIEDISLAYDPNTKLYNGKYTGFKFEDNGILYGELPKTSDPRWFPLFQVALAHFDDPQLLARAGSTTFVARESSRQPLYGIVGESNITAIIHKDMLEMSNVDIPLTYQRMMLVIDREVATFEVQSRLGKLNSWAKMRGYKMNLQSRP